MRPYTATGNAADTYINAMLGLPSPQVAAATAPGGPMTQAELAAAYPQLYAEWQDPGRDGIAGNVHRFPNFADFARSRGMEVTRPAATTTTTTPPATASATDRAAADAAYAASPWAVQAAEGAETARTNANESFMSTAGARGSIVSGRTAAGLYDIAQEAEDQRFREGFTEGWWPAMTGVSDRGYNASVGVGNSSLSTAANVGAAGERAAGATANGQRDGADAMASGINSALYYAGQGWDAWTNRAPRMDTSPDAANSNAKPQKYAKSGGSKYSGG